MKAKQKAQIYRVISQLFLIAVLFGYGLRVEPGNRYIAQAAVMASPVYSIAAPVMKASVENKSGGSFLSFEGCSAVLREVGSSTVLKLQDASTSLIEQNNFTQQAFDLNPNLSQSCADILANNLQVQKNLPVKDAAVKTAIVVNNNLNVIAYKLEQGNVALSFPGLALKTQSDTNVNSDRSSKKTSLVLKTSLAKYSAKGFITNNFEILRC